MRTILNLSGFKMVYHLVDISVLLTVLAIPASLSSSTSPYAIPSSKPRCTGQGQRMGQDPRDKCWSDQGIELKPSPAQGSGKSTAPGENRQAQVYVKVLISDNTAQHCQHKKNFKAALKCAMNYTVSCMPVDYRGYVPQPHKMAALVDKLCENTTHINFACAEQQMLEVERCHYKKFLQYSRDIDTSQNVTTVQVACRNIRFMTECLGAELRPCGCATTRLYETLFRDFLYPPSCPRPASGRRPAICDVTDTRLFAENRAPPQFRSSFAPLCCFLVFFSFYFVEEGIDHKYSGCLNSVLDVICFVRMPWGL